MIHAQTLSDKRTWVKGVFCDCPQGKPMSDCPANGMRSLPLAQFVSIINGMSEAKLDTVIAYHERCVRSREVLSDPSVS